MNSFPTSSSVLDFPSSKPNLNLKTFASLGVNVFITSSNCSFNNVYDAASYTLLKEQLEEVMNTLTPREAKVLKLRFGLEDGKSRTLEEVGREFNVTRERIRQIEAKALRKLRHPSRSKRLKDYMT